MIGNKGLGKRSWNTYGLSHGAACIAIDGKEYQTALVRYPHLNRGKERRLREHVELGA